MKNVRQITEGAVLLAAFTVILLITMYVPLLGSILNLFLPLPFILFAIKNDLKGIVVFFVASILIAGISGALAGITFPIMYGTTGLTIGYLLQKNKSRIAILISSAMVFLFSIIALYVIAVTVFHFDIVHYVTEAANKSLKESMKIFEAAGRGNQAEKLMAQYKQMISLIRVTLPSMLVISSVTMVFILQLVSMPILKRLGVVIPKWKPFRELTLPKSLLWYFIAAIAANLLLHPQQGTYLYVALINVIYISYLLMFFQGLSFLQFFFHKRNFPRGARIILSVIVFIIPVFNYTVSILGIIDLGFNLRQRVDRMK